MLRAWHHFGKGLHLAFSIVVFMEEIARSQVDAE
jgi:hypothetical protein